MCHNLEVSDLKANMAPLLNQLPNRDFFPPGIRLSATAWSPIRLFADDLKLETPTRRLMSGVHLPTYPKYSLG